MTGIHLPRLSDADAALRVVLSPLPRGAPVPEVFTRDGDGFYRVLCDDRDTHRAAWPDGSVGFVCFWPSEDRAVRLAEVYRLARQFLEEEALRTLTAGPEIITQ